jgi:hypothetical protein
MPKSLKNEKPTRNPKFCRFCANHGIIVPEKGHRNKCPHRNCQCDKCNKNAKKVQTSKDHRIKNCRAQNNQLGSPVQCIPISGLGSCEGTFNDTTMTLRSFIESNLDDFIGDISENAGAASNG